MVLNMLTTISMIKVGKTYGNLMVDVQTGSEKLKDRARRILVMVTGLTYDEADALLKRAKWNVKAAIVMQKTTLTLPQALRRLKKAEDSVREAIGEDAEPTPARPDQDIPEARRCRLVEHDLDVGVQLQERRRHVRRDRPVQQPLDDRRLRRSRRHEQRSGAREGSSPSPSTAPRPARPPDRRRRAPRCPRRVSGSSVTRCVRACSAGAGSLNPM